LSTPIEKIGMETPHPGAFIRDEVLDELDLPVARAAEVLGVRRATLSDLVNEKASLTPVRALRMEKGCGGSLDLLVRMQAGYDTARMRQQADQITVKRFIPETLRHG
jgi:addiction module HigA family antidote